MSRLIDADALLERANKMSVSGGEYDVRVMVADAIGKAIYSLIASEPTAYDVDKVVEQLEVLDTPWELVHIGNGHYILRKDAIEIVKKEGMAESYKDRDYMPCEKGDKNGTTD